MTRAEQFILENQAIILCLLAEICQDLPAARNAVEQAELIAEQIASWDASRMNREAGRDPSVSLPSDTENPYFQAQH